jgi:fermentation-respiration switch protein FrsA (DUF1100 family)
MRSTNERSGARRWIVVLVAAALAAFCYLYLAFWFVVHQREVPVHDGRHKRVSRAPPLPYRWLLSDQFNSEALIGGIEVPVMILHGTADNNVPVAEARRLFAAARGPKTMIEMGFSTALVLSIS